MHHPFLLPPLSAEELLELQRLLRAETTPAALYRRGNLIWQLAAGFSIAEASERVNLHYTNAHKWVQRFQATGLVGLQTRSRRGRPRIYQKKLEAIIIKIATSRPQDLGLGFTTWSLYKLEDFLRKRQGLESISRETIRRILGHHGLRFLTGQTWCKSNDPDFEVKKTPL
jgi:transposase